MKLHRYDLSRLMYTYPHLCIPNLKVKVKSINYVISLFDSNDSYPQGTVDNNLGPDRLAGPKALDPNYCRQPTI